MKIIVTQLYVALLENNRNKYISSFTTHNAIIMNIFTWLIIGHLVGDWMLQNDWMARGKARSFFTQAIFVHCAIYTLTLLAALWIATLRQTEHPPYIPFLFIIFASHWLIDAGNLAGLWVRWWRQSRLLFVRIMVDQTLHVLVLALFMEWWL